MKNDAHETGGPPSLTRAPPQLAKQPGSGPPGPPQLADKSKIVNPSPKMPPLHKKPTDGLPPMPQLQPRPGLPPAMPILQPCPSGNPPSSAPGTPLKTRPAPQQLSPGGPLPLSVGGTVLPDSTSEPTQPPVAPIESGQVESVPIGFLKTSENAKNQQTVSSLSPIKPDQQTPNSPSQAKNNPRPVSPLIT